MMKGKLLILLAAVGLLAGAPWVLTAEPPAQGAEAPEPHAVSAPGDCSVSLECPDGTILQCDGTNYSCTTGSNYVECNGQRTYCPSQQCTARVFCREAGCDVICSSSNGDCHEGPDYVRCDGQTTQCPDGSFFICPS